MLVESSIINVNTRSRFDLVDVTSEIAGWISSLKASKGILVVYSPHTTAGIIINEAEPNLVEDIISLLKELTRPGRPWKHNTIDVNAHAHLGQILVGNSRVIPVEDSKLALGTWQRIMLVEMDGPRRRRLHLLFIGSTS